MKTLRKKPNRKARPTLLNGTVPPPRRRNRDVRPREYLTPKEVERLIGAAKKSHRRYGLRDANTPCDAESSPIDMPRSSDIGRISTLGMPSAELEKRM